MAELDCRTCEWACPELLPSNLDIWELWGVCNTQWRVGMAGPVGLDIPAARELAEVLGLDFSPAMLLRVRALELAALEEMNKPEEAGPPG